MAPSAHTLHLSPHCRNCSLSSLCLPLALSPGDIERFDNIVRRRASLAAGETLQQQGDSFEYVYAVRSGSLKQTAVDAEGNAQISGFYLPGELIGMDSIDSGVWAGMISAMERAAVCEIPFERLEELAAHLPALRRQLYRGMSREIAGDRRLMRLLTGRSADERLAHFLLELTLRLDRAGDNRDAVRLPMPRRDIATWLGLAIETVSRVLSRFQEQQLIAVRGRRLEILDRPALERAAGSVDCCGRGAPS
ncbi:helix-turn-helix domain-containing protein [Kushneria aurantia]|uniref:Helix-turn-helix domain-containing protein n=1 Tax=Kushneria aurantia TaxID=504092 RepID=A0ABV6G2C5_9GAMM|nr:helix-turn-helix domain-containing protein [Kushneria aurantia]